MLTASFLGIVGHATGRISGVAGRIPYLSGVAEIVVGVGVLLPQTGHYAALATVALCYWALQHWADWLKASHNCERTAGEIGRLFIAHHPQ